LTSDGSVTIENVAAYCHATDVVIDVAGVGRVVGDVAYGGNWFFLTHLDGVEIDLGRARDLTRVTQAIQDALRAAGITGANGADIDHIELSASPSRADADARNFVLCSGGEYDRSPCGTGTSAVMAARYHRGQLALGEPWRQESVAGSLFTGWLTAGSNGALVPHVRGTAFVTGESTLRFDPADPFRGGLGQP
jgi:proline racemase